MIGGVVETHCPNLLPMFTELFKRFPFTFQQTKPDGLFPFRLMSIIITGKRQLLHCSNHGDLASPQGLSPLGLFADRNAYYLCRGRECARERERYVGIMTLRLSEQQCSFGRNVSISSLWWWLRLLIAAWCTESARAEHLISFALQPNGVVVTWKHPPD